MAENDSPQSLYGVFFTSTNNVSEKVIKSEFSAYGKVQNVKQIQYRVYVNFTSKAAAENLLKDSPHKKYGEIRKGRFGPKESKDLDNCSTSSARSRRGSRSNSQPFRSPSHSARMDDNFDEFGHEESRFSPNKLCRSVNDNRSQHNRKGNFKKANNCQNISSNETRHKLSDPDDDDTWDCPAEEKISTVSCNTLNFTSLNKTFHDDDARSTHSTHSTQDKPPSLLSVHQHIRPSVDRLCIEDYPPPLVSSTSNIKVDSLENCQNSHPRLRVSSSAAYEKFSSFSSQSLSNGNTNRTSGDTDIPPLIQAQGIKQFENGTNLANIHDQNPNYCNQVVIANIPEDTTSQEIEKVLYPLEPTFISQLDVTNVRLNIHFVQILFNTEEEAASAVKQYDGLKLRGYNLTVKRLDDLISLTQLSKVT